MCEVIANVVCVGNMLMQDDGAGPAAARALEAAVAAGVRINDAGLAVSDVISTLDPTVPLVVIDAVRGSGPPGSVYRLRLDHTLQPDGVSGAMLSLHEVSVLPALRMEALSGRPFHDVTVFGIEPEIVEWGIGLSEPVAAGLEHLVKSVLSHLEMLGAACAPSADGTGELSL